MFRGVKLKVKCPVRNLNRSLISWWHRGRRLGRKGAIRTTPRGVLKIREVRPHNAGVYVCKGEASKEGRVKTCRRKVIVSEFLKDVGCRG